ncbi:MAG: hypothetical protein JXM70_20070, partial [Pirellulales bacterium]|nr:hypothetical protein [Pirellulales bacterium]
GKGTPARGEKLEAHKAWVKSLESKMHEEKQELLEDVKKSRAAGNPLEGDVELLESWSQDQAAMLVEALKDGNGDVESK